MTRSHCDLPTVDVPSVARLWVRHPASGYADLLARSATKDRLNADELLALARADVRLDEPISEVQPHHLADFARAAAAVIGADVRRRQIDVADVARLLGLAHRAGSSKGLATGHRDLWLDALYLSDVTQGYPYPRDDAVESRNWRVSVDEMNPFLAEQADNTTKKQWLAELSRAFTERGFSALHLPDGPAQPLHRLGARTLAASSSGPLVSVVIPAFDPDEGPPFSVTSIVRQSWANLEVLICDDGSGPNGRQTLRRWAQSDPRVRVVRAERNGGAYAAMNMGLANARGEFVTFQGSDDWSHPQRIEHQVSALVEAPGAMGNLSRMIQVDDQLALTVLGSTAVGINASSLLFRRTPVLQRLGGMDTVRRAGDNEFVGRIRAVFGREAVPVLADYLALVRRTPGSLSRSDMRLLFRHPARVHYRAGYQRWHQHIAAGTESAWVPPPRRAPIPALARISGMTDAAAESVSVAVLGSTSANAPSTVDLAAEMTVLTKMSPRLSLGLADFPGPGDLIRPLRSPVGPLVDMVNSGDVAWLLPEERFHADLAIIRDPSAAAYLGGVLCEATINSALLVADYSPSRRYSPEAVIAALSKSGVGSVRWLPATGAIAEELAQTVSAPDLLTPRLWGVASPVRPATWRRMPQPLVGLIPPSASLSEQSLARWAQASLPRVPSTRLWCRDHRPQLLERLGRSVTLLGRPRLAEETFLGHVSYLIVPPTPGRGAHLNPQVVRALQHGCVVILDPEYRPHFTDAALYTDEHTTDEWIGIHAAQPECYRDQQRRGEEFLNTRLSVSALRDSLGLVLRSARG